MSQETLRKYVRQSPKADKHSHGHKKKKSIYSMRADCLICFQCNAQGDGVVRPFSLQLMLSGEAKPLKSTRVAGENVISSVSPHCYALIALVSKYGYNSLQLPACCCEVTEYEQTHTAK